ncbi:MAG TPA: MoaD/ThiS family protein [Verrucomicrobiae bacterium]|jgi:molybdopterin synthase catalytic subunit|nr:MoaD/ThiS family protein [Verrucomicrobiae bacterium]
MIVRVVAFARLRELLGFDRRELTLGDGADLEQAWTALAQAAPAIEPLRGSTRFARNGRLVDAGERLQDGDELALLPPVGGG